MSADGEQLEILQDLMSGKYPGAPKKQQLMGNI